MMPNVVRGSHFRGALDYLFDVQQGERSVKQPTLVCSNMAGSKPWELAAEFAAFERLNEKASQPSLHISLSAHPNDHITLEQWEVIVGRFMALFGAQAKELEERPISAERNQFVAIRHSDHEHDHVHLLLNRINLAGEICYCKWDKNRAQAACRELEHEFGLTLVAGKTEAEKTAQRTLAQAARVAKAAGLPIPEVCQREPKRLSRRDIARLERQKEATGVVDPRLQAYQEQRQLETAVPPPAAIEPTPILALEPQPGAVEPALEQTVEPSHDKVQQLCLQKLPSLVAEIWRYYQERYPKAKGCEVGNGNYRIAAGEGNNPPTLLKQGTERLEWLPTEGRYQVNGLTLADYEAIQRQAQKVRFASIETVAPLMAKFLEQQGIKRWEEPDSTYGLTRQDDRLTYYKQQERTIIYQAQLKQGHWTAITGQVPTEVKENWLAWQRQEKAKELAAAKGQRER